MLTEQDLLKSRDFSDAIAYGGWSLDLHPPEGIDAPNIEPCEQHPVPHLYDIPLRSCIARDVSNLMFAGRNISATHVAFASTRVMATCAVMGQGTGTAAAQAVLNDIPLSELSVNKSAMRAIRQQLLHDDAFLVGRPRDDRNNAARHATITASSEQAIGQATDVISGFTRCVHGQYGSPDGRHIEGTHRWMSDPAAGLPAWLQMEWNEPVTVKQVQLVFDTGLHRHLTLSHHNGYSSSMHWGQPQPETVADYTIEVRCDGEWKTIIEVSDNYQRLRRHNIDRVTNVEAMRVNAVRTNGLDHARILEINVC